MTEKTPSMFEFDLIIVGAGPAGMSAAHTAAKHGASVLLLDEQPRAGGQIFRNVTNNKTPSYLGNDYRAGQALVDALDIEGISTEFGATVWRIDDGQRVVWSREGVSHISIASHIVLAGGAQERPMPFPGWTLPGVMSVGAAQILMKTSALLPEDTVLIGSGPLLYLLAVQLINAGVPPKALVETQTNAMFFQALKHLPLALKSASTLFHGIDLLRKIRMAKVKRYTSASGFYVEQANNGKLKLSFNAQGRAQQITASNFLTHQGVVPSTHMSRAAGVTHQWNEQQQSIQPIVDEWGRTNIDTVHIAGDGVVIGGAQVAQAAGQLAALDVLHVSGRINKEQRNAAARKTRSKLKRAMAIRPFLDAAYSPVKECQLPVDETIVCRCEEVTAGDIRNTIEQGANGPRQVKTAVRSGMGACQGRMCELTVRAILESCGAQIPIPHARSPIKPVKLGDIASLSTQNESTI